MTDTMFGNCIRAVIANYTYDDRELRVISLQLTKCTSDDEASRLMEKWDIKL